MSTAQKLFAPTICATTLLFASLPTPATAAEPVGEEFHTNQVVITVQENGEISSVESPNPNAQLRSQVNARLIALMRYRKKVSSKFTTIATGTYASR